MFAISLGGFAQVDSLIGFEGLVFLGEDRGDEVHIELFDGNHKISSYTTTGNGKFILDLERNKYYIVQFSKENYVTKRVIIDTRIYDDEVEPKEEFHFDVFLIKSRKNVDYSLLDFPIAIVQFRESKQKFEYDEKYFKARHDEQKTFIK
ncbi:MAG: hypothetical protein CMP59_04490 [Flavobacteriales bacterium]|nr:hypothetical protein [Flavobacteriales bacterium]